MREGSVNELRLMEPGGGIDAKDDGMSEQKSLRFKDSKSRDGNRSVERNCV